MVREANLNENLVLTKDKVFRFYKIMVSGREIGKKEQA